MPKPKVAFFDFTSCEGCQLQVVSLNDQLLPLLNLIEVVNFREAVSDQRQDYDIAIIDGALSTPEDIKRIKGIREQAKLLITIGACSSLGNVNCIKNFQNLEEVINYVYGPKADWVETIPARPVWAEVKVDYQVPGCPIDQREFVRIMTAILTGQKPTLPNYPVCMECRSRGNVCMYEKGRTCLGPVSRGGCGAICPSYGGHCWACRGLMGEPNFAATYTLLKNGGLTVDQILKFYRMACGWLEVAKGAQP